MLWSFFKFHENFNPVKEILKKWCQIYIFMKKVRKIFSEENTCDNEVFRSITLQPCQFEPEQKKTCANAGA